MITSVNFLSLLTIVLRVLLFNIYSQVVGPRRPLKKDPELDYEVDSDEEWEEVVLLISVLAFGNYVLHQKLDKRSLGNNMLFVYRKKLVKAFQIVRKMKRKVWKKDVQRLMMKMIVKMTLWYLMDISQKMR